MGTIFDRDMAECYKAWYFSPEGQAIERSIEEFIVPLLDPKRGDRILDIGCGSGNHLLLFSRLGLNVTGVDASPYMINQARERLGSRCALKTGMAEDLPFDDNEFDLAVLINTLEFLDDPLQALKEAGRVANRKVFIGVINSASWSGLRKRFSGYLGDPLFSHARFYNLWKVKFLVSAAYGPIPMSWRCTQICPSFVGRLGFFSKNSWNSKHAPFGSFLWLSATMAYRVKTENLPLKIRLKKAGQPVLGGNAMEDFPAKGLNGDGRSLLSL